MPEKRNIEKLIIQHKKSNLKNHWKDSLFYNTTKYSGEIKPNEILVWRSSYYLRGAYPVFKLTFDQNGKLKGIKRENNPVYKLRRKISLGVLVLFVLSLFISTDFKTAIIGTIGILFILLLLNSVLTKMKKSESNLLTAELKESMENIEIESDPESLNDLKTNLKEGVAKEWTFKKILTRLLLYPFCILILWLSITKFLPEGKTSIGIFGIIISLAYPISDILLILGKTKTTANNGYHK